MSKLHITTLLLFVALISSSSAAHIVSSQLLKRMSVEDLKKEWASKGAPEILIPIHYAIDIYDITYTTQWHDGSEIKATGLYMVPVGVKTALPQLIYHHGTSVKKERSGLFFNGEEMLCYFFATDGYSVIMPDYIGLGKGEKRHLYQHANSEADAAIDMLKAVNELNKELSIQTSGQLFLTGYSQGGHACMATHRKLQTNYKGVFTVTASAPMSGAYDMTGPQSKTMFQPYTQPHYLPYLAESYQEAYNMFPQGIDVLYKTNYQPMIRRLYSGKYQHFQINDSLPAVPADIFKDSVVKEYLENENFPFRQKLKENNVSNWKPETPTMLCYCKSDEEVNYQNTIVTYESMKKLKAPHIIKLNVASKLGHGNCAGFATIHTKMFFDSYRKPGIHLHKGPLWKRFALRIGKWKTKEETLKRKHERLMEKVAKQKANP